MEVYVLFGCVPYEGDELLGVYHSLADAQFARDQFPVSDEPDNDYELFVIQRRVIGARAQSGLFGQFDVEG